jgi:ParB family transcriptional regulator, chromosome partitioning protein
MGKLEKLRLNGLGNAAESMGAGVPGRTALGSALHGATALGPTAAPAHLQGVSRNKDAAFIPTEKIGADPTQPREEFDEDELQKLAESLQSRGQLQAITVYWEESRGLYVIVCGERRWRAAKLAGIPTMTATILARAPEAGERLALQCIENLLRSDLRPMEEAKAYRQLMTLNGWNAAQLSRELAVSESKVTRAMALLELPESVQTQVEGGILPPATAYEISKIEDQAEQAELAARVVNEKLSRQDTARVVRERKQTGAGEKRPPKAAPRRAEFATHHGQVTVVAAENAVIAALEEALAQARSAEQSAQSVNSEAA